MTAAERLQAEKERLLATTGFYVPPYRMANLMKAAAKIMDIVIKADTNICYEECRFIMAIVNAAITNVTQVSVSFEGSVLHLSFKLTTIYGEVTIDDCDIAL